MRILITNDDGIYSSGLLALKNSFQDIAQVTVVAPDAEKSAVGHSITLTHPLRVKEIKGDGGLSGYAVNGTPADCVKIALGAIMEHPPDLVISGINHGLNTGTNILYSGTVSGAMEGAIFGLPAIAISADVVRNSDNPALFAAASAFTMHVARIILEKGLPERTFLNINFPACKKNEMKGVAITRQGQTKFHDAFQKRLDPRQDSYYWLEGEDIHIEGGDDLDYSAIKNGYISITPLWCDVTNHSYIEALREWKLNEKCEMYF